jgi:apolipoprotein N-acyltransferase
MQTFLAAAVTAAPTVLDRLSRIPGDFWLRMGIALAVIVVTVVVLRKIAKVNKVVLAVVVGVGATVVGFNWIYERNEPAWATPAVQWIALFLPSKGRSWDGPGG